MQFPITRFFIRNTFFYEELEAGNSQKIKKKLKGTIEAWMKN